MADEGEDHRDPQPERPARPAVDRGTAEADRASSRRRIIITGALAPPAVMTLGTRKAGAVSAHSSAQPGSADPRGKKHK